MPPFQNTPATQAFGFGLGRGLTPSYMHSYAAPWMQSQQANEDEAMLNAYDQGILAQQAAQQQAAREQAIQQEEDRAIDFARQNPQQIGNIFEKYPGLVRSKTFGNFSNIAENQAKQSSLTPSLRAKLPVDQRAHFDQLVSSGHSPVDAYDAAEHQGKWQAQHGELVGAGVPMNRLQAGKLYSPMEMADLKNQAALNKDKMAEKERILGHQIENWRNHIGDLSKMLDTAPDEELPIIRKQIQDAQSKYQAALAKHDALVEGVFSGKPAGIEAQNLEAGAGIGAPPLASARNPKRSATEQMLTTPIPAQQVEKPQMPAVSNEPNFEDRIRNASPERRAALIKEQKAKSQEAAQISQAWNTAVQGIDKNIKKLVPDAKLEGTSLNQLDLLAEDILNGKDIPDPDAKPIEGNYGQTIPPPRVPVWEPLMRKMGLKMNQPAFTEPGKKRKAGPFGLFGSQDVPYSQVFEDWAKKHLQSRGKLAPTKESPTGTNLTPEQQKDFDEIQNLIRSKK